MAMPKSVVKFKKGNVEYVSSVDRTMYTMKELIRAALRDTGKLVTNKFRKSYYAKFKRKKNRVGKYTQYWVRSKERIPNLQVGLKPNGFYGGFQENGSSKTPKLGLLSKSVTENIEEIRKIQGQYLSAIEDENKAKMLISDSEYQGE